MNGEWFEGVLTALIVAIGVLMALVLLVSVVLIYLHTRNERAAARHARLEAEWEPALMEALVAGPDGFPLDHLVQPADRLQFVWFLVRYARRLRGEERGNLQQLAAPFLPEVARRARHRSPEVRARAVQTLVTLGMPVYADNVLGALDDPSPLVAMVAARGLAREEHAVHAPAVLARIDRFSRWHGRFLSAMLGSIGQAAAPALRQTMADSTVSPHGRAVAGQALAQLSDLQAADLAAEILRTEHDETLLTAALAILADVGQPSHLPDVRILLHPDRPAWVRAQALETIACLGSAGEVPLLVSALDDASPWVGLKAAHGLATLGAVDELSRLEQRDDRTGTLAREVLSGSR